MQADDRDGDFADEAVTTELLRTLLPPPPTDEDVTTELPALRSEVRRSRRTRSSA